MLGLLDAKTFRSLTSSKELADLAFEAEVSYFDAPGGNMDQIACAVGGPLRVDPSEALGYKELGSIDFDFVLGDSNALRILWVF